MAIRKDANTLSSTERDDYVAVVKALKSSGIYDRFVLRHANAVMTAIHRSPAFLPWHRRFLWDFEQELQRVSGNPDMGIPYWNWPQGGENASLWNDDLLGGNGDIQTQIVRSGPFRQGEWTIVNSSNRPSGPLRRAFGRTSWARTLPTQSQIDQVLAVVPYDVFPWDTSSRPSFRNQLEGFSGPNLHNRGHGWVGGSMLPMTSPNDPVFFMHHCMVDKLWHEWQLRFPNHDYVPTSGGAPGQNLTDAMDSTPNGPIGPRPIDVLDSGILGIEYDRLLPGTPATPPDSGEMERELIVNAAALDGSIATPGEIDRYRFDVTEFGEYIVETQGPSDTFITLYGPDDPTRELANDDDAGDALNGRISRNLANGRYFPRVRLYSAELTGTYSILVSHNSTAVQIPELTVNGAALPASIASPNESDLYRFEAASAGTYRIETSGSTDVFMTLYGPDSQNTEIASDDDSGPGRNALISASLDAGVYFVRVRHFSPLSTGAYTIRLQAGN